MNFTDWVKAFILKLVFFLVLLCITFALLEGCVRLTFPKNKCVEPVVPASIVEYHSTRGWALKPNAFDVSHRLGYPVEYQINDKGLRDDVSTYAKPAGVFRIVLLGDSRTFGFGVAIEEHFSKLLEDHFSNVEVINLGVHGYGIDQQLLFLQDEGFKYQPDVVMIYVAHYEDHRHMHTTRFGYHKSRFEIQNDHLVLTNVPVHRWDYDKDPDSYQVTHFLRLKRFLYEYSRSYKMFRDAVIVLMTKEDQTRDAKYVKEQDAINADNPDFVAQMDHLGEAILTTMRDEVRHNGAKFILLTPMPQLLIFAKRENMLLMDVGPVLNPSLHDLPQGLGHINRAGNVALTDQIADFLKGLRGVERGFDRVKD